MSHLNKVTLYLQKVKSNNLGQDQINLVNYFVKYYSFTNHEAGNSAGQALQTNLLRSVLFNQKTSYITVKLKSDSFDNATILLPDIPIDTKEDDIPTNTII